MKLLLPLLLIISSLLFSCQETEPILPVTEIKTEIQTCNLFSLAIVQFREGHDGMSAFYYLSLLDDNGNEVGDVYTATLQGKELQVGEEIEITFHYVPTNNFTYVSACGDDPENQPSLEEMAQVVLCEEDGGRD